MVAMRDSLLSGLPEALPVLLRACDSVLAGCVMLALLNSCMYVLRVTDARLRLALWAAALGHCLATLLGIAPHQLYLVRLVHDPAASWVGWLEAGALAVAALWLLGAVIALGSELRRARRARRLLEGLLVLSPPPPVALEQCVARLAAEMHLVAPRVLIADLGPASPALVGTRRSILVVPTTVVRQLTGMELEAVVAHELAHARGADPWLHAALRMVRAALFFHWPVRRLVRAIAEEIERLRDREVGAQGRGRALATGLLRVAEGLTPVASDASLGALGVSLVGSDLSRLRRRLLALSSADERRVVRRVPGSVPSLVSGSSLVRGLGAGPGARRRGVPPLWLAQGLAIVLLVPGPLPRPEGCVQIQGVHAPRPPGYSAELSAAFTLGPNPLALALVRGALTLAAR